jgi:opacity protein-like surface antigen
MKAVPMTIAALALLAAMAVPASVHAADLEITPFIGYTTGGEFQDAVTGASLEIDEHGSYGIALDINQTEDSQIELYYGRQQTRLQAVGGLFTSNPLFDLDIEYFHLGGTYGTDAGPVRPFVVGTIGATHMAPKGERLDSETKLSLSLGGGLKLWPTERIGLRLEARWFGTFFNGAGQVFCTDGSCLIKVEGDVISQVVVNAGLVVAF